MCRSTESAMLTIRGFGDIFQALIMSSQSALIPYPAVIISSSNSSTYRSIEKEDWAAGLGLGRSPKRAEEEMIVLTRRNTASLASELFGTFRKFARPRTATSGCNTKSSKKKRRM